MQQPEIPHSREAEEATIGAVLINEGVFPTVKGIIESPADFYIHRLRWLWESFVKLDEEKNPIDLMTVTDELIKADRVQEIGGPAFITALVASVPTSLNAEHYAQSVRDYAKRRNLLDERNARRKIAARGEVFLQPESRIDRDAVAPLETGLSAD